MDLQLLLANLQHYTPEKNFEETLDASRLGSLAVSIILNASKPQLALVRSLEKSLRAGETTDQTGIVLRMRTVMFREAVHEYKQSSLEKLLGLYPVGTIMLHCILKALTVDNRYKNTDYYLQALKDIDTGTGEDFNILPLSQFISQAENDLKVNKITEWSPTAVNDAFFLGNGPLAK